MEEKFKFFIILLIIYIKINIIIGDVIVIQNAKPSVSSSSSDGETASTAPIQNFTITKDITNGTEFPTLTTEQITEMNSTTILNNVNLNKTTLSDDKNINKTMLDHTVSNLNDNVTVPSNLNDNSTVLSDLTTVSTIILENNTTNSGILNINTTDLNESIDPNSKGSTESISTTIIVTSAEDLLIPPANVTPNIGHMNISKDTKKITVINTQITDCPSLEDADKLSQTQLIERLTHGCRYDKLERPIIYSGEKGNRTLLPVRVSTRAYIYFMQNLEAHDLQFKIHILLQLRFVDPRLAFSTVAPSRNQPILGERQLRERLWVPHIFFANERESGILGTDQKDILTSISGDGTVILSTRIKATLFCWMNLQKFPFDEQRCSTNLESWMYNTSQLVLTWEKKSPVTLAPEFHLAEYVLLNTWYNETVINADLSDLRHGAFAGNYSSLSFSVHLAREMGFYLMDYFLPSMMIVAISWVSFWLQADQSAPRIMLGTSTMLTFITLASAQGKTLPKVSYIKVSEVWFLGCTGFIFGSLVEFAFVNTIWRRKRNIDLKEVNSKSILKATLTPRPGRKDMGLQKSRSCSSLDGSNSIANSQNGPQGFNSYLTVHSFPSKTNIPIIKTESVDDLSDNNQCNITMEPMNRSTQHMVSQSSIDNTNGMGWTTMTPHQISMWIDRRARFIFPIAFIIFNAFFWTFVYVL